MLIPCDEVNILNTFRVMIILRLLLLLTNLHLKLLSTQGTGADKLLSTQRVNSKISILSLNCQSINAKFDKIKIFLDGTNNMNSLSIICIQETWSQDDIDMTVFNPCSAEYLRLFFAPQLNI